MAASGLGMGLTALGYGRFLEPNWLKLSSVRVPWSSNRGAIKILHLSDFHYSPPVSLRQINEAIGLGLSISPDLICLTGDFVTGCTLDAPKYQKILGQLSSRAPTFACLGNHDGGAWAARFHGFPDTVAVTRLLEASKISVLHNDAAKVKVGGQDLVLIGVGDLWSDDLDADRAFREVEDDPVQPKILLSHNPDSKDCLEDNPWDLMLCGHTHGGQVVVPFIGTPFAPVRDHRYVHGLNVWKNRLIYTTRGVGNLHGLRFNCRPEVSVLTLS